MRRVRRRGRVHEGVDGEGKERERKVSEWAVKVFFKKRKIISYASLLLA